MLRISDQSVEYVSVRVAPKGESQVEPSGLGYVAVVPEGGAPSEEDWYAAEWDDTEALPTLRLRVGPTLVPLEVGTYEVWVKFEAGLETPVVPAGSLEVY